MTRPRAFRAKPAAIFRSLRDPWLWLLVAAMVAGGIAAYRVPYSFTLDIGGGPGSRVYDEPYLLSGFNDDPEPDPGTEPPGAFRWAFEEARLVFPGLGRGVYAATLRVATARPGTAPTPSHWRSNGAPLSTIPIGLAPRFYHVLLPSEGPHLDLRMSTPPFGAPGDPRPLAFGADVLHVAALAPAAPAWPVLGWLASSVALAYRLLRRGGIGSRLAAGIGLGLVAVLVWWLAWERLSLTGFAPRLCGVLLAGYLLSSFLSSVLSSLGAAVGLSLAPREARMLTTLVVLAWIIRLGGLLHPQAYTSDLGLHMHNLEGVVRGEIIFTEDLPSEAGGGPAPYPPAQYVMLAPWRLLASTRLLTMAGNTLADSLVIVALGLLLHAAGAPLPEMVFGAALYLFATPLLISLSVGEMANVWGQALVGPLALVILRWQQAPPGRRPDLLMVVAMSVVLLGHFGVFLSLLIFLAAYSGLLLILRGPFLHFATLAGLAVLMVTLLYYGAFMTILVGRGGAGVPFGWGRLRDELAGALGLVGSVGPLLSILGLAGLILLVRDMRLHGTTGAALGPLLVAWCLSTIVSLGSLLWTQQALRWEAFLFPALALCGGVALAGLHRRGRLGMALAYALLGLTCVRGASLWYWQIATYQH